MSGQKIIDGLQRAVDGDISRVTIHGQLWTKHTLPNMRCEDCDAGVYDEWAHCPFCGQPLIIAAQRRRITDLETALLAATDLAKRQCERIEELEAENTRIRAALAQSERPCAYCSLSAEEWSKCASGFPGCARGDDALGCPHLGDGLRVKELEAERDARPVARWVSFSGRQGYEALYFGRAAVGHIAMLHGGGAWKARPPDGAFPTPEAAKAAVEEALRGL